MSRWGKESEKKNVSLQSCALIEDNVCISHRPFSTRGERGGKELLYTVKASSPPLPPQQQFHWKIMRKQTKYLPFLFLVGYWIALFVHVFLFLNFPCHSIPSLPLLSRYVSLDFVIAFVEKEVFMFCCSITLQCFCKQKKLFSHRLYSGIVCASIFINNICCIDTHKKGELSVWERHKIIGRQKHMCAVLVNICSRCVCVFFSLLCLSRVHVWYVICVRVGKNVPPH